MDIITESAGFMVVHDKFSHITLHALHEAEPLRIEESAFVLGQIFAALEYLHGQGWTHGNLDPRSVQVMSRKHLWIKLTDVGLAGHFDLGKSEGYRDLYASQATKGADQQGADIWSAGVVALQLLLPSGLPKRGYGAHYQWVHRLERTARRISPTMTIEATTFVKKILVYDFEKRPTATEVLKDPWIVRHRGEEVVNNFHFNCPTPVASRHASVDSPNAFSRQGSTDGGIIAALQSRPDYGDDWEDFDSVDWNNFDRVSEHGTSASRRSHGTATPLAPKARSAIEDKHDFSRQSSIDPNIVAALQSRPGYGDDWNDFDSVSEHGTSASRHSHSAATPLARSAMEDNLGGKASQQSGKGSRHSHSRSSRGGCSEKGSTTTQSSRFTANPLAREPNLRHPTPSAYTDIPGLSPRPGSTRSPPRSRAAISPASSALTEYDYQESSDETITPGPSRSQSRSRSEEVQALEEEDETTSALEPAEVQSETELSEDYDEEMDTDEGAAVVSYPAPKTPLRAKNGRFLQIHKGKGKAKAKGKGKGRVEK